jgi:hypothetical protein
MSPQQILLVDPVDGRTIARLSTLQPLSAGACAFSPAGSKLVTVSNKQRTFQVWDLRLVRERLAAMGLDWNQPAYDEKLPAIDATGSPSLDVQVIGEIPEPKGQR